MELYKRFDDKHLDNSDIGVSRNMEMRKSSTFCAFPEIWNCAKVLDVLETL
jgi:hypothetical protein